jgi:hypothetical protein
MPSVPTTINHAINQEQAIEDFFNGIELTIANINSRFHRQLTKSLKNSKKYPSKWQLTQSG